MKIAYDRYSYTLDGERIWLMSGSMHYGRVPEGLWRDRMEKAKASGLNCIETYVAWNLHEPREGEWDFEGDKDVAQYVRLAHELGLYVIIRPGPYICAEWDFGGFPAWLTTKPGIFYRNNNPVYTRYYEKFLDAALPHLAPLQVTRGGPILLIQNENEYYMSGYPGCGEYLENINRVFRKHGFDIPIINCNRFSQTPSAGTIECVNTWGTEIQDLKRMRARQPDAPLLVTEFWAGGFDTWGWPHRTREPRDTARRLLEMLGCGAQLNPYMWHGGTNFGFWGSRLIGSDAFYQVTSYDMDAALAEGGLLTRKYYLSRLVTMLGNTMGRWFSAVELSHPAVNLHDTIATLCLTGPNGDWITLTNHGNEANSQARISLPNGDELTVRLDHFGGVMLPLNIKLTPDCVLDYANLMPLGWFNDRLLVLHGPMGADYALSLNGERLTGRVQETPKVITRPEITIAVLSSEAAERAWWEQGVLVIGPDYLAPGTKLSSVRTPHWLLRPGGALKRMAGKTAAKVPAPPSLGTWELLAGCEECRAREGKWQPLKGPIDFDRLENYYGYGWYRVRWQEPVAREAGLFMPESGDRVTVFLNGKRAGTWGRGVDATREPLLLRLRAGENEMALLADNLGRFSHTDKMGELKGIWGPLYSARPMRGPKAEITQLDTFEPSWIPQIHWHRVSESSTWRTLNEEKVWRHRYILKLKTPKRIHLSFNDVPHNVAVFVNGRQLAFYPYYAPTFGDLTLSDELPVGDNMVEFVMWGEVRSDVLRTLRWYVLDAPLAPTGAWAFRRWPQLPRNEVKPRAGEPAWFSTTFPRDKANRPLFVSVGKACKGQIYLNGHNLGRYWNIGPSGTYYLPECWMKPRNELVLFDEFGRKPAGARLHLQPVLDAPVRGAEAASNFFTV